MRFALILLMLAAPLLEIALLIKIGQTIGVWWTLAIIVGTGLVGLAALTENGLSAPLKMQDALRRGETPVVSLLDGALMALGGFFLLLPGFIGDTAGLLLLVPPVRAFVARWALRHLFLADVSIEVQSTTWRGGADDRAAPSPDRSRKTPASGTGPLIEGEYRRLGEDAANPDVPGSDGDKPR